MLPPRFSVTDLDTFQPETHTAWLALVVGLGWLLALARAQGPWSDAARCTLLLALAAGTLLAPLPEPLGVVLFNAVPLGGLLVLARVVRSWRSVMIAAATAAWLFAGLVGWGFTTPIGPGWLVLLVMPAVWPLGVALERALAQRAATPTAVTPPA